MSRKPTIYDDLVAQLGREPTGAELRAYWNKRSAEIGDEVRAEMAAKGTLPHQRGRYA